MKKILVIYFGIVALISLSTPALAGKIKTITFCTHPYAPFIITDQDNNHKLLGGFDFDLANAICKIVGAECKFTMQQQLITLIANLNAGDCDAWMSGLTISPDRKQYLDFTEAYYPTSASLIAPKNSTFTAEPRDLKNKKVGVANGSNFVTYLDATYGSDIDMVKFGNEYNALTALRTKKVDAVISDAPMLQYWMEQKGNEGFRLIDLPSYNKEFALGKGCGIAVKKDNTKLLNALNQALTKIKADGTYDKIAKKYSMKAK
ncbi:MAG: transporter substrate-binding domain-containing protein [bacterium]